MFLCLIFILLFSFQCQQVRVEPHLRLHGAVQLKGPRSLFHSKRNYRSCKNSFFPSKKLWKIIFSSWALPLLIWSPWRSRSRWKTCRFGNKSQLFLTSFPRNTINNFLKNFEISLYFEVVSRGGWSIIHVLFSYFAPLSSRLPEFTFLCFYREIDLPRSACSAWPPTSPCPTSTTAPRSPPSSCSSWRRTTGAGAAAWAGNCLGWGSSRSRRGGPQSTCG